VLVIKVNAGIYVSKELRTQHGWPFQLVVGDTQQIPYPPRKKSRYEHIVGHPNFALVYSSPNPAAT
jgi:hypothetical protein